jgi:predicted secreted protein
MTSSKYCLAAILFSICTLTASCGGSSDNVSSDANPGSIPESPTKSTPQCLQISRVNSKFLYARAVVDKKPEVELVVRLNSLLRQGTKQDDQENSVRTKLNQGFQENGEETIQTRAAKATESSGNELFKLAFQDIRTERALKESLRSQTVKDIVKSASGQLSRSDAIQTVSEIPVALAVNYTIVQKPESNQEVVERYANIRTQATYLKTRGDVNRKLGGGRQGIKELIEELLQSNIKHYENFQKLKNDWKIMAAILECTTNEINDDIKIIEQAENMAEVDKKVSDVMQNYFPGMVTDISNTFK